MKYEKIILIFNKIRKIVTKDINPEIYKYFWKLSIFISFMGTLANAIKFITVTKINNIISIITLSICALIVLIAGIIIFYVILCALAFTFNVFYQLYKVSKIAMYFLLIGIIILLGIAIKMTCRYSNRIFIDAFVPIIFSFILVYREKKKRLKK